METEEQWKPIPDFEHYLVSSKGNIKTKTGRLLRPYIHTAKGGKKYKRIYLYSKGKKRKCCGVHRLMCLAFYGEPPEPNMDAAHLDDDGLHNDLNNLAWLTKSDNMTLMYKNKKEYETQYCNNCPCTAYDHDESGQCHTAGCSCKGWKRRK